MDTISLEIEKIKVCVTPPKSVCSCVRGFDGKSLIWLRTCAKLCLLQDPSMGRAQAVALKIGFEHVVRLKKRAPTTRKGIWLAALKVSWFDNVCKHGVDRSAFHFRPRSVWGPT